MPYLQQHPHAVHPYLVWGKWTPPYGAALAMTRADLSAVWGLGLIVLWTALLGAAMVALERRPARARVATSGKLQWAAVTNASAPSLAPKRHPDRPVAALLFAQ